MVLGDDIWRDALGSRETRRTREWATMVDPAGLEFWVTDRSVED